MGRLAVKSGMWLLYEREYGKLTINSISKAAMAKPIPIEEYLAPQGRFRGISQDAVAAFKSEMHLRFMRISKEAEGTC